MRSRAKHIWNDTRGVTLIEIIAALVILAALAGLSTMFLAKMAQSYQWAKDNAHLTQKAQVALTRIASELSYATQVKTPNTTNPTNTIKYNAEYPDPDNPLSTIEAKNLLIGKPNNQTVLKMTADNANLKKGHTLTDNVTGFSASRPESRRIDIELRMQWANGVEQVFTTSIALR